MMAFALTACSPTPKSILKNYEEYSHVTPSQNRLGIQFFHESMAPLSFFFANTSDYLGEPKENYHDVRENMKSILSERFVVLDAKNTEKPIDFKAVAGYGVPNYYDAVEVTLLIQEMPRFILVGFKGVRESESVQWNTPALFFLFENGEDGLRPLTLEPFLADDLFPTDFSETRFVEVQPLIPVINSEYKDKITIGGGKTLSISFSLSDKGGHQTIIECKISVERSVRNADGSNRVTGSNYLGYNIAVGSDGIFNQTISDYSVSGKVSSNRITGSIKSHSANYSYSAKEAEPEFGNTDIYKSMESTTVVR
ncbi:MAG: hypothetical protein LBT25_09630 [Candidatus Symbiothrix sp.]|nr:hypothetical protein [Candidatus Symbiothrix sp.]